MGYRQVHDRSLSDPEDFWSEAADAIDWERRWNNVLQSGEGPFDRWFAGGMLNTCHNALDRHVDGGRGEQIALIHDSPVTDTIERLSYRELRDRLRRYKCALHLRPRPTKDSNGRARTCTIPRRLSYHRFGNDGATSLLET